jgi:hypothetical protein
MIPSNSAPKLESLLYVVNRYPMIFEVVWPQPTSECRKIYSFKCYIYHSLDSFETATIQLCGEIRSREFEYRLVLDYDWNEMYVFKKSSHSQFYSFLFLLVTKTGHLATLDLNLDE